MALESGGELLMDASLGLPKELLQAAQRQDQYLMNSLIERDVLIDESLEVSKSSGLLNQTLSLVVSRLSNESAMTSSALGSLEAATLDLNAGQIIEQLSAANAPNLTADEFGQAGASDSLFLNGYQDEVTPSVYDQDWQDIFHSKLLVYVNQKLDQVHIKLHPEEMGPVDIKLSYQQNEANLSFTVYHAETKEMLLASQEKLKELFQYQGLQLGSFDVHTNQDAPSQQSFSFHQEESSQESTEESAEWLAAEGLDDVLNGPLQKPLVAARGISVWV
jgi:flagellar hook-length control protein FliK